MSNTNANQPSIERYVNNLMYDYNANMQEYNENVRMALRIYSQILNTNANMNTNGFEPRRRRPYENASNIFSNMYSRPFVERNAFPNINMNTNTNTEQHPLYSVIAQYLRSQNIANIWDNVIVRPTQQQIETATECFIWERDDTDAVCPITLAPFIRGNEVCRIKHCNHIFNKSSLMDWFQRNVHCPVCRFDIRDHIQDETNQDHNQTEHNRNQDQSRNQRRVNTSNGGLLQNITSALRTFINSEIGAGTFGDRDEITFTFDIPPIDNDSVVDLSYNSVD